MASNKFTIRAFPNYQNTFAETSSMDPVIDLTAQQYADVKATYEKPAITGKTNQTRAWKVSKYSQADDGTAGTTLVESWEADVLPANFTA